MLKITTNEVKDFGQDLVNTWGLVGWSFVINYRARTRMLGRCSYSKKTIEISNFMIKEESENEILDTILHEIAHALTVPGAGHGPAWKINCKKVKAKPERVRKNNKSKNFVDGKLLYDWGYCS